MGSNNVIRCEKCGVTVKKEEVHDCITELKFIINCIRDVVLGTSTQPGDIIDEEFAREQDEALTKIIKICDSLKRSTVDDTEALSCTDCIFMRHQGRCWHGYGYEGELMIVGSDFCCGAHRTYLEQEEEYE